jgi:YesN/AraC family two-component response regulator
LRGLRVLIINDDYFILQILAEIMKKEFIREIDTAMNGYQAFNLVLVKDYDLIICDLNMPVMDGFEFCVKAIKHFSD